MIYLDTSAAVPLFINEPDSNRVEAWLASCDRPLVAADWIVTEFASALALKRRMGVLSPAHVEGAEAAFEEFCAGGLRLLQVSRLAYRNAAKLVREHSTGLRAGDALHLAVALEIEAGSIATLDANLAANACHQGLQAVAFDAP